jgi:hypothetical protein
MPDRQPTVYLHIGIAKTGTTYLQQLLWRERHALARHGVVYPAGSPNAHFMASVDLRQKPFAGGRGAIVPGTWNALAGEARSVRDRAVISHESLARANVAQVRRAVDSLAPAEVHVIVTVRDLARQLPAAWQERVKNRSGGRYREFLRNVSENPDSPMHKHFWEAQDVVRVLERYGKVIPADRIHVVTVPPRGSEGEGLWERFASVLGLDPDAVNKEVPHTNVSLGVAEAELLRRMNRTLRRELDLETYVRAIKVRLSERLAQRGGSERLGIPHELREWLADRAKQLVAGIEAGGYDVVGDLADLQPVLSDEPVLMPRDVPDQQLFDLAGIALAGAISEGKRPKRDDGELGGRARKRAVWARMVLSSARRRLRNRIG